MQRRSSFSWPVRSHAGLEGVEDAIRGFLPRVLVMRERPEIVLVRPVLALTLYLQDDAQWAFSLAAELLRIFFSLRASAPAQLFRTSIVDHWARFKDRETMIQELRAERGPRHLFRLSIADRDDVPTVGFRYFEVKPGMTQRCGYAQMTFPLDSSPQELFALISQIAQRYPLTCALAGPSLLWNEELPKSGFRGVFRLCRRFLGLDVQFPDEANRFAREWLPSIAWVTLVSPTMLEARKLKAAELAQGLPPVSDITVTSTATGLLFRAGATPEIGDVNALEIPRNLLALTRHLGQLLIKTGIEFPDDFQEPTPLSEGAPNQTKAWRERLVCPQEWS